METTDSTRDLADWLRDQPVPFVKVAVTDLDGMLRAKYLSNEKVTAALEKGFGFCNVLFAWDRHDLLYTQPAPADPGYADARATLAPETYRTLAWEEDTPLLLADFRDDTGVAGMACPRALLRRIVERAAEMGFTARFGPEYEWFTYRADGEPLSPGMDGYSSLRTGEHGIFFRDLLAKLEWTEVTIEGFHTETGPGALEAAIAHQEALEAADRAVLFLEGVRQVSFLHGLRSSFMAKPTTKLPGCGGHLHQSLWREGRNVFHDPDGRYGLSGVGEQYLAGQLALLPALQALFAPTVNSYKRYVPGSWAATRANWGIDNRTVAIRLVPGGEDSTRLETRVPGADANPYLAIAAALAAGLYGIEREMTLDQPPVVGSAYEQQIGTPLADNLGAAAGAMGTDGRVAELLGREFTAHYAATRRFEWQQFLMAVTDWERERYGAQHLHR
jgi:glutamine synthetase